MWCFRGVLRTSLTEKITSEEVLQKIDCERLLINILDSRKLTLIVHQLRKGYTLVKDTVIRLGVWKETARKTKSKTK